MVQTDLDICKNAVSRAGGEPIEAIGEDTPLGAFCAEAYPQKKAWLLGKHRWTFTKRVVALSRETVTPAGWPALYKFAMPGDVIGAIHAYRDGPTEAGAYVRALVGADGIASDAPAVYAEYTAQVPEALWPVWFAELAIVAFAADVAVRMRNDGRARDLHMQAFGVPSEGGEGGLYAAAVREDGRNAPQRQLAAGSIAPGGLLEARYGGWTSNPFANVTFSVSE
jgi:hypothetical protein